MKKDFQTNDLMRIVGLAPRKRTPESMKYGRFNRRMMAATIDSFILLPVMPLLDPVFQYFYGASPVDFGALREQVRAIQDQNEATRVYWSTLYEQGFFRYWTYNTMFQFGFMASLAALCWMRWSATPGKMIMRLKVVDAKTEQPISVIQSVLRAMAYFVSGSFFLLGFVWIVFDKKRQGWHDKIADTVVVTVPWKPFNPKKKTDEAAQAEVTPASEAAHPSGSQEP